MFADSTLKVIKKMVDGNDRPLWLPGMTSGEPDTVLGYPYTINQDVAAMAANGKSVLFGDFGKYIIRDIRRDIALVRLVERYAEYGQVAFLAFARHDGKSINAAALKHYANSAAAPFTLSPIGLRGTVSVLPRGCGRFGPVSCQTD